MSNIKSYLQTLFKMSGSQSAPKANGYIELNVQNGTTYVAPSDGYVSIASENTQGIARITVEGSCESGMNSWGGIEGTSSSLWVRVNKGDMVSFTLENLKEVYWARFIRTVGGGKILVPQRFKWRYSPCLRLKTSFVRSSKLAQATLSPARSMEVELISARGCANTPRRATGTSAFIRTIFRTESIYTEEAFPATMGFELDFLGIQPLARSLLRFLFVREVRSSSLLRHPFRRFGSRKQGTQTDFVSQEVRYAFA